MRCSAWQLLTTAILLLPACGDETPFSPTPENVAGSYQATTLTATQAGITLNLLQLGSSISLVMNQDGTTSGRLLAPGQGDNGEDIDADLTGTWTLQGSTVTFDQPGDTFIRDVPFSVSHNRLSAEGIFDGNTIAVVLTK